MPGYSSNPLSAIQLALPGTCTYFWGSLSDRVAPTKMTVSNVALTTNVATLTVQVIEGNVPVAGQLVTVTGTQSTSGLFNVTAIAIASATINATTGAGTITFALTHANVGSAADSGLAVAPPALVFESPSVSSQSVAVALPMSQDGKSITGHSIEILWASNTSAGAVDVQYTDDNSNGGTWSTLNTITYPATRYDPAGLSAQFVRLNLSSLTTATTIAARVLAR